MKKTHSQTPKTNSKKGSGAFIKPKNRSSFLSSSFIQPKLSIGASNDKYEQEADALATKVVNTPDSNIQVTNTTNSNVQRKCSNCEEEQIQRKPLAASISSFIQPSRTSSNAKNNASPAFQSKLNTSKGSGSKMETTTQNYMESRFGANFNNVRIHTNANAVQMNKEIGAKAFTNGSDIYFNQGRYNPNSTSGKFLLAHELTHTIQQSRNNNVIQRTPLEDCIAELGGDRRYRDAGNPSYEEIESYRRQCERRLGNSEDQSLERLSRAWEYAREYMGEELASQVEHLFSPESLAAMVAFAALYAASQLTPVGWAADAFVLMLLTLSVVFVGATVISIGRDIYTFFSAVNATTEEELRTSGRALARALAQGGVTIFLIIVSRGISGRAGGPRPPRTSTAMVEVVTTNGTRMRVPVSTIEETAQVSEIQGLLTYMVVGPPPQSGTGTQGRAEERETTTQERPQSFTPGSFSLSRVDYGASILSRMAQNFRILRNLRSGHNIAVFEFENTISPRVRARFERLGGDHVLVSDNRLIVQNVNGAAHSEVLANQLIMNVRRSGHTLRVSRIYSEYNPCSDTCLPMIRNNYPNSEVTFSFTWERWGRETNIRNTEVEALFQSAE